MGLRDGEFSESVWSEVRREWSEGSVSRGVNSEDINCRVH